MRRQDYSEVKSRKSFRDLLRHENAVLMVILIVMVIGLGFMTKGLTLSRRNVMNVIIQSSARGVATIGQAFVILTGGIDVSVGGIALLSGCLGASLMTSGYMNIVGNPLPMIMSVGISLLFAASLGIFNGVMISRVGVSALITTLSMWQILTGFGYQIAGGSTIMDLPESMAFFGLGYIGVAPVPVLIFVAVVAVSYFVLYYTAYGREVYAVGGNPMSSWLSGINVRMVQLSVYVISGFLAGLAAVMLVSRTMTGSMNIATGLELDSIAGVCIGGVSLVGGRGSLIGVVIGIIIIGVINNGMNVLGIPPSFQDVAKGAIILVAVTIDAIRRR